MLRISELAWLGSNPLVGFEPLP